MYQHERHFTLEEAQSTLEEIKTLIEEMVRLKHELDCKGFDIYRHQYFGGVGLNGTGEYPGEMERLIDIVKTISSKGVLIKGIDNGLIDFPHIRQGGDEVYLCWKAGEESIAFWHRIPDGFQGRRNIKEL
jgi:hypothetical protein